MKSLCLALIGAAALAGVARADMIFLSNQLRPIEDHGGGNGRAHGRLVEPHVGLGKRPLLSAAMRAAMKRRRPPRRP